MIPMGHATFTSTNAAMSNNFTIRSLGHEFVAWLISVMFAGVTVPPS